VAARRRDLIVAQTNEQLAELRLKNLFVKSMTDQLAAAPVTAVDQLPTPQNSDIPPLEQAIATAMRYRPEITAAEGNILNQQVATEYTRRRLKPTLNVFGLLSSGGREGALGSALAQTLRYDYPEYAFGFSLSFLPHNRAAQADDMRARLDLRQAETGLERTRNQIRLEVRNAIIGLLQARAQVSAASRAVELSLQTLDAEEKKLRAGTSVAYNVIRIERDVLNAQQAEVQARVNYAKARVELERATGMLLEHRGFPMEKFVSEVLAMATANGSAAAAASR
jgi:outer membrane protein TolC